MAELRRGGHRRAGVSPVYLAASLLGAGSQSAVGAPEFNYCMVQNVMASPLGRLPHPSRDGAGGAGLCRSGGLDVAPEKGCRPYETLTGSESDS